LIRLISTCGKEHSGDQEENSDKSNVHKEEIIDEFDEQDTQEGQEDRYS
jgi:hypothetical protein